MTVPEAQQQSDNPSQEIVFDSTPAVQTDAVSKDANPTSAELKDNVSGSIVVASSSAPVDATANATNKSVNIGSNSNSNKRPSLFQCSKPQDLKWRNINMKLMGKNNQVDKYILKDVWGCAPGGQTTAIMGASGAGKTSLFSTLAGRISNKGKINIEHQVFLDGVRINPNNRTIRNRFAYVSQFDSLHETSTPREALYFSAKLRLPRDTPDEQIHRLVQQFIDQLGLANAADTVIGGTLKKGISGGEKRRVSIAVELVSSPNILFLDEPTSGLDSYAASQVMSLLDSIAKGGNTVLFTIHQPSSKVFTAFDNLILLNQGRVMHAGQVRNLTVDFETRGFLIPNQTNPADHIIDVAQTNSIEELEKAGFFPNDDALRIVEKPASDLTLSDRRHVSFMTELKLLQWREMYSITRNPTSMILNVFITGFMSIVFGVIFLGIGSKDRSDGPSVVNSVLGACVNILISTMMGQSNSALYIFATERPVFLREYSTDHYSVIPYVLSHLWGEAIQAFAAVFVQSLITYFMMGMQMGFGQYFAVSYALAVTSTAVSINLGAIFEETKNAASFFTLVVVPQFYFSGLFIAIELIPPFVRWAQYLCSLTYASRLMFAYEFQDCDGGDVAQAFCDDAMESNNVDPDDTWWYWLSILALFVFFRTNAVLILQAKASY